MGDYFIGITDKGRQREKNEDTFIAEELFNKRFVVACVIDGVGGYSGGEIAAGIARTVILEHIKHMPADNLMDTLRSAIMAANNKILDEKQKDDKNELMACVLTCAIADMLHNKFYYAHVGDTRLYLLRDHSLIKISTDHSAVGFLEESGRLTEEDAMRHPKRNEIDKALGFEKISGDNKDFIETGESPFLPGDTMLVCSDGLTDMITSKTISSILQKNIPLTEKVPALINAANDAGGNDNITAVLVQNYNQPLMKVAQKPVARKIDKEENDSNKTIAKEHSKEEIIQPAKKGKKIISILSICCIGLLFIMLFEKSTGKKQTLTAAISKEINKSVSLFSMQASDSSKTYSFSQKDIIPNISAPVLINKDSFRIAGNGITITSDSNYKGPAIIIDKHTRYIMMENIVFRDFDVALVVQNNNVVFNNVRFINCQVPVQYQLSFPDTVVSGRIKDSIFIPVLNSKKN